MIKAIQKWGTKHDKLSYLLSLALIGLVIGLLVFNAQQSYGGLTDVNIVSGNSYSNANYTQILQFYNEQEGSLTIIRNEKINAKSFNYTFNYGRMDVSFSRSDESAIVLYTLKNGVYNQTNNIFYFND